MKKIILLVITTCLLLPLYPLQSNAETRIAAATSTMVISKPPESAEAVALLKRLDEIKAIDRSDLNSPQKSALRKEIRSIKQKHSELGGGVYFSSSAVIIILVLLIISV